jgi:uncharacterized LabA/DUF88 family protein
MDSIESSQNQTGNGENQKIYKSEAHSKNMIIPGDSLELPDDFLRVVVFIDNAYLIRLKNHFFKGRFKYSLKKLISIVTNRNNLLAEKIFLYDAPPFQDENPSAEENLKKKYYDKFAYIFKKQGIILREGRTQRLKIGDDFVYKQKGVDMLMGIDAISVRKDFPKIQGVISLTGDSDFFPLVEKLRDLNIDVFVLAYLDRERKSPFSKSNELVKSATKCLKITKQDFLDVGEDNGYRKQS